MAAPMQGYFPRDPKKAASLLDLAIDVKRDYGASFSVENTTGDMTAGGNAVTLADALDFANGNGINIAGAAQITTPTTALVLAQAAGSSSFTASDTVYVNYCFADASGNPTGMSTQASIAIATAGNVVTTTIALPTFADVVRLFVGTASGPLQLAEVDYTGGITYSGGVSSGLSATIDKTGMVLSLTISASASATGAAQPTKNTSVVPLVTTIQSGAGSTSLVLADAADNAVSGAVVYHDDTAAIVAAMKAAHDAASATLDNGGGVVLFPPGLSPISSVLRVPLYVHLRGTGGEAQMTHIWMIPNCDGAGHDMLQAPYDAGNTSSSFNRFGIQNIMFDGNSANQNTGGRYGLKLEGAVIACYLENVWVRDIFGTGILLGPGTVGAADIYADGLMVDFCTTAGIQWFGGGFAGKKIHVENIYQDHTINYNSTIPAGSAVGVGIEAANVPGFSDTFDCLGLHIESADPAIYVVDCPGTMDIIGFSATDATQSQRTDLVKYTSGANMQLNVLGFGHTYYTNTLNIDGNIISTQSNLTYFKYPTSQGAISPPASPLASGTIYQNAYGMPIWVYQPAYATTSGTGGTVNVQIGPASPPTTTIIPTQRISGSSSSSAPEMVTFRVPPGYYYRIDTVDATLADAVFEGN